MLGPHKNIYLKMLGKLVLVLCIVCIAAAHVPRPPLMRVKDIPDSDASRIISGEPAIYGQFPWQVANFLFFPVGYGSCGAALICDRWVLTAAHCAEGVTQFMLFLGSIEPGLGEERGRVILYSTEAYVHPDYNSRTLVNDVALIKLRESVKFTNKIQPIPLGKSIIEANVSLTVSGWGKTSDESNFGSSVLNFVHLKTISNDECASVYGSTTVKNSTICCRGNPEHSTCEGDSGGPLVGIEDGRQVLVGVVSFVHIYGCASGNPSGYGRTASHLEWISSVIGDTCVLP